MRKEKFCPTCNEEAETHIWSDFYIAQVIVEINRKVTYDKLLKKDNMKLEIIHLL